MKKLRSDITLFYLSVVLLCYRPFVQYGRCSEQNKADLQNQPQTAQDNPEQQDETKGTANDKDPPSLYAAEHQTQSDAATVDEQHVQENRLQGEEEKEKVDGTPTLPDVSEHGPEASITPELGSGSQNTHLSPVPGATLSAGQSVDVSATAVLPQSAECSDGDSCTSASLSAVPPTAACDAGENPQYDTDGNSLPMGLENGSTPGTGENIKDGLGKASQGTNASSMLKEKDVVHITTESESSLHDKVPEDIPTFDEWKKIIMEVENEKSQSTHTSCNGGSTAVKKVQKTTNYASVECGAKILSSNPEAKSTSAILMENVDVYMLNPCSNKIWFIIELCQPIQVKQLDIANFELFSSTPKDFLVSISDRYPTNKWSKLGTFHARDERTVQSFPLDEHLYAKYVKMFTKYIKVELLSHFGSEHFCPLSLIRVFGTSMMEEYELNSEASERLTFQDEDDDYPPGYVPSDDKSSKNLIGSAKDVIINMVNNIAANVLGGNPEDAAQSGGNSSSLDLNVTETLGTPVQTVLPTSSSAVIKSLEDDQHDLKLTETTSVVQSREESQTSSLSIITLPEASLTTQLTPESLSPTLLQVGPIVTLLPKDEESDEEDQSEQSNPKVDEQTVKTGQDQPFSGLLENVNCCEHALDSCSCVISLEEYLLQCCFPHSSVQRKSVKMELQESQPESGFNSQESNPSSPDLILSLTDTLHTRTMETSAMEASVVVVPPFSGSDHRTDAGSLALEPSLTSALATFSSTDTFSSTATHAVDFLDPSNIDLSDLVLKEKSREKAKETPLAMPHLEPTSSPILIPKKDGEPEHEQTSLTIDKPSADMNASSPSVTASPVEQVSSIPSSNSTDQPFTQPDKNEGTAPTGILTAVPVTETSMSEPKDEDLLEEAALGGSSSNIQPGNSGNGQPVPPPSSEFYAEMQGSTEAPVHGSNQKESVFMRLNNRIKALEVNMSLSGRYLEQLSQRYRKQMEEMQKAFNKTIIKLQNTSRIAEEQDQKQTESILVLQRQLENMTALVLNLSVRVSHLQREVSDRHSYLLLCVVLCLLVCVLISIRFCRTSAVNPPLGPDTSTPDFYSYCCPDRASPGYEGVAPKRRASYPMSSLQIVPSQEPNKEYHVEIQTNSAGNKKKKRCKMKSNRKPETITPTILSISSIPNGNQQRNSHNPQNTNEKLPLAGPGPPPLNLRDSSSEGSSEDSTQSDEPLFCGIATCRHLCDTVPHPQIHSKKRSRLKKRSSELQQLLQPAECKGPPVGPQITLHGLIRGSSELRMSRSRVSQL